MLATLLWDGRHYARCQDAPNAGDVLLRNERGELTEFTIGNLVLEVSGKYLKPQGVGLLAGTLRQEELETGWLKEKTLCQADLERARV